MAVNIYEMTDTWNNGATAFTAIEMNVTDTASAAASLMMDLQVGGVSQFKVTKAGKTVAGYLNSVTDPSLCFAGYETHGFGFFAGSQLYAISAGVPAMAIISGSVTRFGPSIQFAQTNAGNSGDLILARDAANTLAQRNGVNAQTSRVYSSYTNVSNNEGMELVAQAGDALLRTFANGTGTRRNIVLDGANRGAHIADPTGGVTTDAEARTAINAILVALENHGLVATS